MSKREKNNGEFIELDINAGLGATQTSKGLVSTADKDDAVVGMKLTKGGTENSTPYPLVKRMLITLDKFLDRRIASIAAFYALGMIIGGLTLFMLNNPDTNAAGYDEATASAGSGGAWAWSFIGVITFLFALVAVRVISLRVNRGKRGNNK